MNIRNTLTNMNRIILFLILFCGIYSFAQEKVVTLTIEKARIVARDLESFKFEKIKTQNLLKLTDQQEFKIQIQDTIIQNQIAEIKLKDIIIESKQEQIKIYKNKSLGNKILLYGSLLLSGYLILR